MLMRLAYRGLVYLLVPPACAVLVWRGLRDRGYWRGFGQRFGFGACQRQRSIWVHAVSVGEVQAAAALVRALRERQAATPLTLTTATPTGAARARALFGDTVDLRFLPFDTPGAVRRFLDRVQPQLAIIVEKEIWPNLYRACGERSVPLVLASAALPSRSLGRYRRLFGLFADTLAGGLTIAAQGEADAARFREIGVDPARIRVIGNLKFDLVLPPGLREAGAGLRARHGWQQRFVLVAGSTYAAEEAVLLGVQRELRDAGIDLALVIAPRHPPRFDEVAARLQNAGVNWCRHSTTAAAAVAGPVDVLLLDTLGELLQAYAAADAAFVGGSLLAGVGGHNLIEPAALAVPTLTGPHCHNAADIARALAAEGALAVVADAGAMSAELRRLIGDPTERVRRGECGRAFVSRNRGTLDRLLALLDPLLR